MERQNVGTLSGMSEEVLLSLDGITITRLLEIYRHGSFRDAFIGALTPKIRTAKRVKVLTNVSLRIHRGDRVGILGPNGAGKSTLCRSAAGLLPPDAGTVSRSGTLRAIFESQLAVQPELTGRENGFFLADFLYPHLSRAEKKPLIDDALEFSGLGDFLDSPFRNYSFGMQTRLGLSILSSAPSDILVLDEVFQGADKGFQQRIVQRFYSIMKQSGAVLFVSHSPEEVRTVCNRTIVMDQGQIVYDGPVECGIQTYESLCQRTGISSEPISPA
jgi:ABC-type polysaccharide/polyol phosphate transport system ATPase subunit